MLLAGYEAYVVGMNGTAMLYGALRISKESVPEVSHLSERRKGILETKGNE